MLALEILVLIAYSRSSKTALMQKNYESADESGWVGLSEPKLLATYAISTKIS